MDTGAILDILMKVDWVQVFTIVITILFFLSEALANIPQIKENSVFQLSRKLIKLVYNSLPKKYKKERDKKDDDKKLIT